MFLIDRIKKAGIPLDFTFSSRSSLLTMEKKAGGEYQAYKYKFRLNGAEVSETIFPAANDFVLSKAEVGQVCRAEVDPKNPAFVKWSLIPFGEKALESPNPGGNYGSQKAGKEFLGDNDQQRVKSIAISLQGFAQSYISGRHRDYTRAEFDTDISYALDFAEMAYKALQERATKLSQSDQ